MELELKKILEKNGFDVDKTLERFMNNENLYYKFLKKFTQDTNFADMLKAVEGNDCERAFTCAHTLKGVTANLGIIGMYEILINLVEKFRAGSLEGIESNIEKISEKYKIACDVIEKM